MHVNVCIYIARTQCQNGSTSWRQPFRPRIQATRTLHVRVFWKPTNPFHYDYLFLLALLLLSFAASATATATAIAPPSCCSLTCPTATLRLLVATTIATPATTSHQKLQLHRWHRQRSSCLSVSIPNGLGCVLCAARLTGNQLQRNCEVLLRLHTTTRLFFQNVRHIRAWRTDYYEEAWFSQPWGISWHQLLLCPSQLFGWL